jgi:hypothetical protein
MSEPRKPICDNCSWCKRKGCNEHENFSGPITVTPSKPLTPTEPSRGTICKCGLAKSYHFGPGPNLADHEYEPRYPARRALDATQAVEPSLREALDEFAAGRVTERLAEYATNPDDPLHADIQELLTAFHAALAARSSSAPAELPELDAAWREAEEALPEGWRITGIVGPVAGRGEWTASSYGMVPEHRRYADGPTPAAALRALASRLTSSPENPA